MRDRPFEYTFGCFAGCVGILVLVVMAVAIAGHVSGCLAHMEKGRDESKKRERIMMREQKERERLHDDLRNFALRYAPRLWETSVRASAEITNQNERIERLEHTLRELGRDPAADADFQRICQRRDQLVRATEVMRQKLEDAYLAAQKSEVIQDGASYQDMMRQILQESILEAEKAESYFIQITKEKAQE